MYFLKKYIRLYFLGALLFATLFLWYGVLKEGGSGVLTISFLDVGQGDAIFIESPTGVQVLIDGGAGRKVLSELASVMPFYDRSLDVIMATHPDLDHIGGLPPVFESYEVGAFIEPPFLSHEDAHKALHDAVSREGVDIIVGVEGTILPLGGGAELAILFPERDMTGANPNDTSLVTKILYGETSVLLSGDSPSKIEKYVSNRYGGALKADLLKAGHHGSNTSSSEYFLNVVSPHVVVVSAGKDNRYGHPHEEVLERIASLGAILARTDEDGRVTFISDGSRVVRK